ncbi:unnamed protein product [Amoebophrya sp. A25]|nr:unnamed protein product [Amoebophrya sp. A25]|eukprot:GSA25T00017518001.1
MPHAAVAHDENVEARLSSSPGSGHREAYGELRKALRTLVRRRKLHALDGLEGQEIVEVSLPNIPVPGYVRLVEDVKGESPKSSSSSSTPPLSSSSSSTRPDGTGSVLWPASVLCARFLTSTFLPETIALSVSKRAFSVVELGCGLGLPGIACAHWGSSTSSGSHFQNGREDGGKEGSRDPEQHDLPVRVWLTDQCAAAPSVNRDLQPECVREQIEVGVLSWGKDQVPEDRRHTADLILGTDLLYCQEASVMEKLVETIDALLKIKPDHHDEHEEVEAEGAGGNLPGEDSSSSNSTAARPCALIAFEMRGTWFTQVDLCDMAEAAGFQIETLELSFPRNENKHLFNVDSREVKVYKGAEVEHQALEVPPSASHTNDEDDNCLRDDPTRNDFFLYVLTRARCG